MFYSHKQSGIKAIFSVWHISHNCNIPKLIISLIKNWRMKCAHLLILFVIVASCQNSESEKVKRLERRIDSLSKPKEPQVSIREIAAKIDAAKPIVVNEFVKENKKYCYVYVETSEPVRDENFVVAPTRHTYASQIFEEPNFNDDRKYFLLDKYEKSVKDTYFSQKEWEFQGKYHCKVTERTCYTFDTYKEASEHRRKMEE